MDVKDDVEDLLLVSIGSRIARIKEAGPEDAVLRIGDLEAMSKEELEEFYTKVAGEGKKTFKNHKVALENVVYQAKKMPAIDDVKAEQVKEQEKEKKAAATADAPAKGKIYERKNPNIFHLVAEPSADKLAALPPQAKECVAILIEFARETQRDTFSEEELKAKFAKCNDRLKTRQDPWRIFSYYRSKLIAGSIIRFS